jgi:hypothetical protein
MRYRLRTLLIVLAVMPPLLMMTFYTILGVILTAKIWFDFFTGTP